MLQISIEKAIAEIAAIADHLPGVVTIHDIRDWSVAWMSDRGLKGLNVSKEEIFGKKSEEYYPRFFNPDDAEDYVPKLMNLLQSNNDDEILTFFQQVKLYSGKDWTWHMSSVKVLLRDEHSQPVLVIAMSFPIDAMHHMTSKASRLLEENNFLRKNFHLFAKLSNREKEVLRHMALGKTSAETATDLFISQNTVETHRKNIRQKLNTSSYYEVCQYARAFDLI